MPFTKMNPGPGRPRGSRKMHSRTMLKIEMAVRLELSLTGLTDAQIAQHIGMKIGAYRMLKKTAAFQQMHTEYQTGVIADLDHNISEIQKEGRRLLEVGVPIALRNLVMNAAQRNDKKLQMEATKEILDREGHFGKVSRIGLATEEQGGFASDKDNDVAAEIVAAMARNQKKPAVTIDTEPPNNNVN